MPPLGDGCYRNDTSSGVYLRISAGPQRGRYVHQLVAEAMLGRPLREDEQVDHKNQNTLDNRWENLEVITLAAHTQRTNERRKAQRPRRQRERRARRRDGVWRGEEPGAADPS